MYKTKRSTVFLVHAKKAYQQVEVQNHSFLPSAVNRVEVQWLYPSINRNRGTKSHTFVVVPALQFLSALLQTNSIKHAGKYRHHLLLYKSIVHLSHKIYLSFPRDFSRQTATALLNSSNSLVFVIERQCVL